MITLSEYELGWLYCMAMLIGAIAGYMIAYMRYH